VWNERIERGINDCKTWEPHGGTVFFELAQKLVRSHELPLDKCRELILEHFQPRAVASDGCTPWPWSEKEIHHKLTQARDKGHFVVGDSADWDLGKWVATPRVTIGMTISTTSPERKTGNPNHTYTFQPNEISAAKSSKRSINEIIFILTREDAWAGVWQYEEFSQRCYAVNPPMRLDAEQGAVTNNDITSIRAWLECRGTKAGVEDCKAAVHAAAELQRYHAVREYLLGLPAGEVSVLEGLAKHLFGAESDIEDTFLRKTLIGAVRRVLDPGSKFDTVLTLVGDQGTFKSTFVKALFGKEWTAQDLKSLDKPDDATRAIQGKWGVEIAELQAVLRTDPDTVKAFITKDTDRWIPKFEEHARDFRRQCVFIGTTNKNDFLRDETGDRRFWPIKVTRKIDLEYLAAHRDAIWAAARDLALAGELPCLNAVDEASANELRTQYQDLDPWHEDIFEYCRGREWVHVKGIWKHLTEVKVFNNETGTVDRKSAAMGGFGRRERQRIEQVLTRMNCTPGIRKFTGDGQKLRGWGIPEHVRTRDLVDGASEITIYPNRVDHDGPARTTTSGPHFHKA
jgi:predicted P-loop ATPase